MLDLRMEFCLTRGKRAGSCPEYLCPSIACRQRDCQVVVEMAAVDAKVWAVEVDNGSQQLEQPIAVDNANTEMRKKDSSQIEDD